MDSVLFVGFLDYSLVFKGLGSWFFSGWIRLFLRIWISFVADTKMKKTPAGMKLFRLTFILARRKADMPDEPFFAVFEPLLPDIRNIETTGKIRISSA